MTRTIVGLVAIAALALIVFGALAMGVLSTLLLGVVLLCVIGVALSLVGVNLFSRYTGAVLKRDQAHYDFLLGMAGKGLLPNDDSFVPVKQIAGPVETDIPITFPGGATETAVAPYSRDALEVVALSKQIMGEQSDQIIPHAKAKLNDYFRGKDGYEHWNNGCQWLIIHQWAEPRKQGQKHLGTFCASDVGTVGRLYDRLKK